MAISTFKPLIKRKEMDAVLTCMVSADIGYGKIAKSFIYETADFLGFSDGIVLREYYRALSISLDALKLKSGAKIIISPLSPSFYINAIKEKGYEILYADVEPDSGCMNPQEVKKLLEYRPDALIVHYPLGFIPDMEELSSFNLPLIEDISTAIGSRIKDNPCGSYGQFTIVSLDADNILTSGGGAFVFSMGKNRSGVLKEITGNLLNSIYLPDVNAALGLAQLKNINSFLHIRKETARIFSAALMKSKYKTIVQNGERKNIHYSFPVLIDRGMREVKQYAKKKGICTIEAFKSTAIENMNLKDFPCRESVSFITRGLLFPLYPGLGEENCLYIAKVLSSLP